MSAYLWTQVVLGVIALLFRAYYLGAGRLPKPSSLGTLAIAFVVDAMFLVWALKLLGVL